VGQNYDLGLARAVREWIKRDPADEMGKSEKKRRAKATGTPGRRPPTETRTKIRRESVEIRLSAPISIRLGAKRSYHLVTGPPPFRDERKTPSAVMQTSTSKQTANPGRLNIQHALSARA